MGGASFLGYCFVPAGLLLGPGEFFMWWAAGAALFYFGPFSCFLRCFFSFLLFGGFFDRVFFDLSRFEGPGGVTIPPWVRDTKTGPIFCVAGEFFGCHCQFIFSTSSCRSARVAWTYILVVSRLSWPMIWARWCRGTFLAIS